MPYNVNPMQLVQMIKQGQNPQQLLMSVLESRASANPLYGNLYSLARDNNSQGIEKVIRTMFAENGLDFDQEFNRFKNNLGL